MEYIKKSIDNFYVNMRNKNNQTLPIEQGYMNIELIKE
jgi:hypothetical protein